MLKAMRVLARLKGVRGTRWDLFGRTAERRMERQLLADYEAMLEEVAGRLTPANHRVAVELARLPEHIRGFGHVKERHVRTVQVEEARLRAAFRERAAPVVAVAAALTGP
jgi:indolepyruvate ferredoxin oxidoreductase